MNASPFPSLTAQLSRLSIGISRTSIRLSHSKGKRKEKIPPSFKPGHGEKIWIFSHFRDGLTVYSHNPVLKANKALRQIPFNGKKLKPSKLRKDYWRPLAMIQFPEGMGHVGQSVYHIMREFRMKHDLSWGIDMTLDQETGRTLTRLERGERLNDQKANSIADMAAVLGGAGKGNKMWMPAVDGAQLVETNGETKPDEETGETAGLLKTTVFWANKLDKNYARKWPVNVLHSAFDEAAVVPIEEEALLEPGEEETSQAVPAELLAQEQGRVAAEQPRIS